MPAETAQKIEALQHRSLFIIDALRTKSDNISHYSMIQAITELRKWKPTKSYLIGMSHEFDYDKHNEELKQQLQHPDTPLDIEIPYEGLRIKLGTSIVNV